MLEEQGDRCDTQRSNALLLIESEACHPLPVYLLLSLQMTDKEKIFTNQIKSLEGDLAALAR